MDVANHDDNYWWQVSVPFMYRQGKGTQLVEAKTRRRVRMERNRATLRPTKRYARAVNAIMATCLFVRRGKLMFQEKVGGFAEGRKEWIDRKARDDVIKTKDR